MADGLTPEDKRRYSRQIKVDGMGTDSQLRLKRSKVFIVGCGALGSMIAMQLAGAGTGTIAIADFDTIDVSNLQRQFFFTTSSAGEKKSEILKTRMEELNPHCKVVVYDGLVTVQKASDLFAGYDIIVDATDNVSSKKMVESVCRRLGKTCCIGGVAGFKGQVLTVMPGSPGIGYLFPDDNGSDILPCEIDGVMGPSAALCGSIQASETIKFLTGAGECLGSKVLVFDLRYNSFNTFKI